MQYCTLLARSESLATRANFFMVVAVVLQLLDGTKYPVYRVLQYSIVSRPGNQPASL